MIVFVAVSVVSLCTSALFVRGHFFHCWWPCHRVASSNQSRDQSIHCATSKTRTARGVGVSVRAARTCVTVAMKREPDRLPCRHNLAFNSFDEMIIFWTALVPTTPATDQARALWHLHLYWHLGSLWTKHQHDLSLSIIWLDHHRWYLCVWCCRYSLTHGANLAWFVIWNLVGVHRLQSIACHDVVPGTIHPLGSPIVCIVWFSFILIWHLSVQLCFSAYCL